MMGIVSSAAATFGLWAVKAAKDKAANVISGAAGLATLEAVRKTIGKKIAPFAGKTAANVIGKMAAGHQIEKIQDVVVTPIKAVVQVAGDIALDTLNANKKKAKKKETADEGVAKTATDDVTEDVKQIAENVVEEAAIKAEQAATKKARVKQLGDLAVPLIYAAGAIVAPQMILLPSAVKCVKGMVEVLSTPTEEVEGSLRKDVLNPLAQQVIANAAGAALKGLVQYHVVTNAANTPIKVAEKVANGWTKNWAPKFLNTAATKLAGFAGKLQGYENAFSPEVLQEAVERGELVKEVTKDGCHVIFKLAGQAKGEKTDMAKTAEKVFSTACIVMGTAGFCLLSPALAPYGLAAAGMNVLPGATKYLIATVKGMKKDVEDTKDENNDLNDSWVIVEDSDLEIEEIEIGAQESIILPEGEAELTA